MQLELYKTIDPANKLNKNLTGKITREIRLKQDDNILAPKIILKGGDELKDYNYGFIVSLSRYYFITGKRFLNNDHIELTMKTDVLMTYKTDINKAKNLGSREGVEIQTHRLDSNVKLPEDENSYVLITVGG